MTLPTALVFVLFGPDAGLRVTLELLYGMARVIADIRPQVRTLVGDVEEHVALRHLLLTGLDVRLVEGTVPQLAERDLMHHAYVARASVKPFVTHLPDERQVRAKVSMLEDTLASPDLFDATRVMARSSGALTRVTG